MRIGLHTSIAGSLERSALRAAELGANTFQIFSSSPRQWKASVPSLPAIRLLNQAREKHDLNPLAIHDNYLINLASAHEKIRQLSIEAFRGELVRAVAIGADYLIAHPDVNDFFTSLKGQPRDQIRDQVQTYLDANPKVREDPQGIRQPSVSFRDRCGAPATP